MAAYSFMDVAATLAGPGGVISLGYGSGTAKEGITIERSQDKDVLVIGADGTPMHSLHSDNSGHITVRLLKTSPVNGQLATMYDLQILSSANWGINTLVVSDTSRGDIHTCQSVAFQKFSPNTYAEDANIMEWQFSAGQITALLGG